MERLGQLAADHVAFPRNAGKLTVADASAEATNPACGDHLLLGLRFKDGLVTEARFMAEGCAATRACGSRLTELIHGWDRDQLTALTPQVIVEALGGLPSGRFHAAELAARVARLAGAQEDQT